jgi:competence protein ComFC
MGWRGGVSDLLDFLLDRTCPGCAGEAPRGREVCDACDALVPRTGTALCLRCLHGDPADSPASSGGCPKHGSGRLLLAGPRYEPPLDRMIAAFKYEGARGLAPWIASLLPEPPGLEGGFGRECVLVPVPLHPARRSRRGFDQTLLLAGHASGRWGIPVVRALARTRDHEPQARLGGARRHENVRGVFRNVEPALLRDRPVLLVDDVATTGSTLLEAAAPIEAAGARWILALTAAHGGGGPDPEPRSFATVAGP